MVTFAKLMFPLSPQAADNGTVSDLCEAIYSGGTPTTTEADYWNGPYPWLSSGETSNDYIIATEKTITEEGIKESSTRLASKGSIVIASAGQGLTRGQTSLLLIDTYVNQSVIVLRPKEGCGEFLFSNLKGRYDEMRNISDLDSIRGSLTTKTISALPVCISDNKAIKDFSARCIPIIDTIHKNELEIRALKSLAENITCSISSH